ncbi:C2H2-type zinc finger protein [uncultured Algibacter sp.]|uniref:C2H2-type zinc finger protein n=1 Tax=uncultured Algibacter sp. TaxID=298659 RepID=UPI003216B9BC
MRKFILNEAFGIIALSVLLIPQIAHTIYVFKINSQYHDPWFSWCYAIGVDLAILIFTVKGWTKTAYAYFIGTLAHNLVYQFYPESIWSSILICIMLSATIFSFSHLFYHKDKAVERNDTAVQPQASAEALRLTALIEAGISFEAQPFLCPECKQSFVNSKKLNGHISGHKQKDEWLAETYGSWENENLERNNMLKG